MSKNGKSLPDVDLNSFEIKINFVNVAVLEKNHKIEIGNHLEGGYKLSGLTSLCVATLIFIWGLHDYKMSCRL